MVKKIVEAYQWMIAISLVGWMVYLAAGWLPLDTAIDRLVVGASIVCLVMGFYEIPKMQREGERAYQEKRQATPPEVEPVEQVGSQGQGK